jgi:hypothetical protein
MATEVKAQVLRDFKDYSPPKKVLFGNAVTTGLGDFPLIFTGLKIPVADLITINNTLNTKNLAAASGNTADIDDRDNYLPTWNDAFDQNADSVQSIANGDTSIIDKSGYHHSKTHRNGSEVPVKLLLDGGPNREHGSIWFKSGEAAGNHASYITIGAKQGAGPAPVEITVTGNVIKMVIGTTEIYVQLSTKHEGNFTGLAPRGAEFNMVMTAFNAAGMGPLSEPVSVMVP